MVSPPSAEPGGQSDLFERAARGVAALAIMVGLVVLLGWTFDLAPLKSVLPGWAAMKANAAIGFVLAGIALWGAAPAQTPELRAARIAVQGATLLLFLLGAATITQGLTGRDFGIGELLFSDPLPFDQHAPPGGMAPQTALSFALIAVILFSLRAAGTTLRQRFEAVLALPVLFVGLVSVASYLYGVPAGGAVRGYSPLPFHTSLGLLALGVGVLAARGRDGLLGVLTSDSEGGRVARRMLPWVALVPLGIGGLRLAGETGGLYGMRFGVTLFAVANVLIFAVLLWWTARSVDEADTHRLRSTRELEISEARYQRLFEDSPVALYRTSPNGEILAANRALARLLGYPDAASLKGSRARDHYARGAERDEFRMALDAASTVEERVTEMRRTDGSIFWAVDTATAVRGADGRVQYYEGSLVDITEQRLAEQRLLASEQRFRALIEQSADGITLLGADGRIQYSSPALQRLLGWTAEQRLGGNIGDLIHTDDQPAAADALARALQQPGAVTHTEVRVRHADGSWHWIESSVTNLLADEHVGALVVNYRDVTARKNAEQALRESEERFRQMAEHIHEAFFVTDLATRQALYVSPTWSEIWGRPIAEGYEPQTWFNAIHPDDRATMAASQEAVACGTPRVDTFRVIRPDGSVRWVRERAFPVRDEAGRVYRMAGVAADITELREAEERFIEAQRMEAVGRLAGGVAHDFNNLLTVINSGAELALADIPGDSPAREILAEVRQAGDSAISLTRQLLAFSRRQIVEPTVLDLNVVVTDTARMLRRLIGERVQLITRLAPDAVPVRADRGQLEQVLTNLAVNARDAMPDGGELTIASARVVVPVAIAAADSEVPAGEYVTLAVSDTGSGMSADVAAHAFEPFYTTKARGKGTGLGLATCHGIVRQAGGYIVVDSAPGAGTTFRVYFPPATGEPAPLPEVAVPDAGHGRVLVVEDNTAVRRMAARMLRLAGYQVAMARDAEEALNMLKSSAEPPDVLLADVVLPGLGGRELAKAAHQLHPGMKVLYATGYTDDDVLREQVQAHEAELLRKPYTAEELAAKLRSVMDAKGHDRP